MYFLTRLHYFPLVIVTVEWRDEAADETKQWDQIGRFLKANLLTKSSPKFVYIFLSQILQFIQK